MRTPHDRLAEPRRLSGWRLEALVLLAGGAVWSIYPDAHVASLLAAWAIAYVLLTAIGAQRFVVSNRVALVAAVLLAIAPLAYAARLFDRFVQNEGLDGLGHRLDARDALREVPAIHPHLVSLDRPQTFYVNAPGAERVALELGGASTEAVALGHGLFRLELDPRADRAGPMERSLSEPTTRGEVAVRIVVDGTAHARTLDVVRPLAHPRWLAASPDGRAAVAVSEETDELAILELDGPLHRVAVDDGPVGAAFVSSEDVLIASRYAREARLVRWRGAERRAIEIGYGAVGLAVSPARSDAAIVREGSPPELVMIDVEAARVRRRVPLGFVPDRIAYGADERTVLVSERAPARLHRFIDGVEDGTLELARPIVVMSGGGPALFAAVTEYRADGAPPEGNHFVQDTILRIDVGAWRVTHTRRTASRTDRQRSPGDLDRGVSPMGLAPTTDGGVWVACAGSDDLLYLDRELRPRRTIELDDHPLAGPHGIAVLDGGSLAVSSPIYGTLAVLSPRGEPTTIARLAPDDQTLLRTDEDALKRRIGERTFYETTRAGVSCQSCHLHGGSDGARHDIGGATMVATLDVRGAAGTPPYLRDGGYPTLGSLDEVARTLYRGYRRNQGGRRPGLDAYLSSLARETPRRQLEGHDVERERRGVDAFVRARCVVCHAFPAFTDLSQHDAEWLFPGREQNLVAPELDTPSLLGLERSAPYLVDGRAARIGDVIGRHDPAHRHGRASVLSADERRDLVHLLEGL